MRRAPIFTTHHEPNRSAIPLSLTDVDNATPFARSYMAMKIHQHTAMNTISLTIVQTIRQSYEN